MWIRPLDLLHMQSRFDFEWILQSVSYMQEHLAIWDSVLRRESGVYGWPARDIHPHAIRHTGGTRVCHQDLHPHPHPNGWRGNTGDS